MKKIKKNGAKTIIFMVVFGVLVIGLLYFISNPMKKDNTTVKEDKTEVGKLINKDLELAYPGTPREVVKLYSRIIKCYYDEGISDEEISKLSEQAMLLYDDDLLDKNQKDKFTENLKSEITEYKEAKRTIVNYTVEKSSSVYYYSKNKRECASIFAEYMIKENTTYSKTYEEYVLRKDSDGRWKILGWEVTDAKDIEE